MKDKIINEYRDYLQKSKVRNIRVNSTDTEVYITTSFWNDRTFIDIALVGLVIYVTYTIEDKNFYMIPIIACWAVLAVEIWGDFNRINEIRVNLASNKIEIISRNFLKRVFFSKKQYDFSELSSFKVRDNLSTRADSKKYFVDAKLKNEVKVTLTFFTKEEDAYSFISFLNRLIRD